MAPHGDDIAMGMDMNSSLSSAATSDSMSGMDMSSMSGSSSSMMTMMAVFQNAVNTPLYTMQWTPTTTAGYAGTCVFLICLAMVFRGLLAAKSYQESRWLDKELNRRYVAVKGKGNLAQQVSTDSLSKEMTLSENGVEEGVMVVKKRHTSYRPFRLSVDPIRAVIDTVIAGVGYLMMLAVMTMNVGYFFSILGGVFLGSLLVGRYTIDAGH